MAIEMLPGGVGGMASCSLSRADALPGSVWRVRWAEGETVSGSFRAVQKRCCRGAFGAFGGPRAGCVRQFRSSMEVVPRSVFRDGKRNAVAMEAIGA